MTITIIVVSVLAAWFVVSVIVGVLVGRFLRDVNDRVLALEGETVLEPQEAEEMTFRLDFFAPTGADPR